MVCAGRGQAQVTGQQDRFLLRRRDHHQRTSRRFAQPVQQQRRKAALHTLDCRRQLAAGDPPQQLPAAPPHPPRSCAPAERAESRPAPVPARGAAPPGGACAYSRRDSLQCRLAIDPAAALYIRLRVQSNRTAVENDHEPPRAAESTTTATPPSTLKPSGPSGRPIRAAQGLFRPALAQMGFSPRRPRNTGRRSDLPNTPPCSLPFRPRIGSVRPRTRLATEPLRRWLG